jgi:hypothetical protein
MTTDVAFLRMILRVAAREVGPDCAVDTVQGSPEGDFQHRPEETAFVFGEVEVDVVELGWFRVCHDGGGDERGRGKSGDDRDVSISRNRVSFSVQCVTG